MGTPKEEILNFMSTRPEAEAIIGYGSGVKPQKGQENRTPQIDLIVVVDSLQDWHTKNIQLHPEDYSFTSKSFFRHAPLSWLRSGGKICYMTYIPFNGRKYKIGTIERRDFLNDLKNWDTFYMAGRMQKPILIVKSDKEIESAIEYNRHAGVLATKLMLGEGEFSAEKFYTSLASLSYIGDTRMGIAENPDKVKNIVLGNPEFYNETYGAQLDISNDKVIIGADIETDTLPDELKDFLDKSKGNTSELITTFFTEKNKSQSVAQTIKGLFTTGPIKAIKYASEKLKRKKKK